MGETLKGVIIDWSNTEIRGLNSKQLVMKLRTDSILHGCCIHWVESVTKEKLEIDAYDREFCKIAKSITEPLTAALPCKRIVNKHL